MRRHGPQGSETETDSVFWDGRTAARVRLTDGPHRSPTPDRVTAVVSCRSRGPPGRAGPIGPAVFAERGVGTGSGSGKHLDRDVGKAPQLTVVGEKQPAAVLCGQAGEAKSIPVAPGRPWENGYIESFHSRVRDEFLEREEFESVAEARAKAAWYRREYNTVRPHSSLGYATQKEFSAGLR